MGKGGQCIARDGQKKKNKDRWLNRGRENGGRVSLEGGEDAGK